MINADDPDGLFADLEMLGITGCQAVEVMDWHRAIVESRERTAAGVVIIRLIQYLFGGASERRMDIRAAGVLFAFGLQHAKGWRSMDDAAEELGCSQPAIVRTAKLARAALERH